MSEWIVMKIDMHNMPELIFVKLGMCIIASEAEYYTPYTTPVSSTKTAAFLIKILGITATFPMEHSVHTDEPVAIT
jgi:hypothetical protein